MQIQRTPQAAAPPVKMVAMGDSLTAGMQDATLDATTQAQAYTKQLADQVGIPFSMPVVDGMGIPPRLFVGKDVSLPRAIKNYGLLAAASLPPFAWLQLLGMPPDRMLHPLYHAGDMGQRTAASLDTPAHPQGNYAVPGFELRHIAGVGHVDDFLAEVKSGMAQPLWFPVETPLVHAILQNGTDERRGSEVDQAVRQDPDLVVLWPGNNDALEGAITGGVVDDRVLTPMADKVWDYWDHDMLTGSWRQKHTDRVEPGFASSLHGLLDRLEHDTHAEIMLLNVPDVTVIPYLHVLGGKIGPLPFRVVLPDGTDVTRFIENLQLPTGVKGTGQDGRTQFPAGSRVGLAVILEKLVALALPEAGAAKAGGPRNFAEFQGALQRWQSEAVFSENDVLDPDELATVQERIHQYNGLMQQMAQQDPRIHLIDANGLLETAKDVGVELKGAGDPVRVTNTFTGGHDARGYGGIFSFDGVHPSNVGHAVLANMLLQRIQHDLGGQPKFQAFRDAALIDEKAAYRNDPHQHGDQFRLILSRESVAQMRKLA